MSTDTDYVITVKGKDAALRKAAAEFIELSLSPWNPSREDKKTLTRLDVFRNESNCAGFFAPSSLCEEAAKLFPGANVSFSSKNEYGYTEEGEWAESGEPPDDVSAAVAAKVFERIQAEIQMPHKSVAWLAPLAEWASENDAPKKITTAIRSALAEAEGAKNELEAELEAEAEREKESESTAAIALESTTRWSFHPAVTVESRPVGSFGQPALWHASEGPLNDEGNVWGAVWVPCKSKDVGANLGEILAGESDQVMIGHPIKPESKAAQKLLENQLYAANDFQDSGRIFVRTAKGVRALRLHIHKQDGSFFWLHSHSWPSNASFKADTRQAMRLSELLEGAVLCEITAEHDLSGDKQTLGQEINENCLALSGEYVFVTTDNSRREDPPSGRIYCLSLTDGSVVWASEARIRWCGNLIVPNESALLAVISDVEGLVFVCLEKDTGRELWRHTLDPSNGSSFQLAASRETAVLLSKTSDRASVSLWRIDCGKKIHERPLPEVNWQCPQVVMDSSHVYVAGISWVMAFSHEGEDAWTTRLPEGDQCKIALTARGTALISRGKQGILCVHCETGATAWTAEDCCVYDCIVGLENLGFFAVDEGCMARDIRDGSLAWQTSQPEDSRCIYLPVAVTSSGLLVRTDKASLKQFDASSGTDLGSIPIPRAGRLMRAIVRDRSFVCTGSFWCGPSQVVCLDLDKGTPVGPWPMERRDECGASFLRLEQKQGYKQFIAAWKAKKDMSPLLARLGAATGEAKATTGRIHGIIRGHEMVAQAKLWAGPSIGAGDTAPLRGAQWRLVMAYGGFELLAKSLTATKRGGLEEKTLSDLIGKLSLPNFDALVPPSIDKSSLKKWMEEEDASDVLDFLKMENGDRKQFDAWLAKQKPVETWTDAVLLAKSLRSATVHGALSPTKIQEWKIGDAIFRLTDEIFRLDEAVFEVLG